MDTTVGSHVIVKLFIGCAVTPEVKMHLTQSNSWKQANIMRGREEGILSQTHFHQHSYIGLYADEQHLTLAEVRSLQHLIQQQLSAYCPKMSGINKLPLYIFPQFFVS
jgi:hypothetical protein